MRKLIFSAIALLSINFSSAQITYTFNGSGNWSDTSNWVEHQLPPEVLPDSSEIVINPINEGVCILDTSQIIAKGGKFSVSSNTKFVIKGNFAISDSTADLTQFSYFIDTTNRYMGADTASADELANALSADQMDTSLFPIRRNAMNQRVYSLDEPFSLIMPDPGNQNPKNSCTGWAVAYALSYLNFVSENNTNYQTQDKYFSPEFIWNPNHTTTGIWGNNGGLQIPKALNYLLTAGCCKYVDMPASEPENYFSPASSAATQNALNYRIKEWRHFKTIDIDLMIDRIKRGFPLLINVQIDLGFMRNSVMSFKITGGKVVWVNKSLELKGNHALVITGYNNDIKAFKVLNSWGFDWPKFQRLSEPGYFYLDYTFLEKVIQTQRLLVNGIWIFQPEIYYAVPKKPQVTVTTIEPPTGEITSTTALIGGTVTVNDATQILETGVCYSYESDEPTTGSTATFNKSLIIEPFEGQYFSYMSGLSGNKKYFARFYARTNEGIVYGPIISFRTLTGVVSISKTLNPLNISESRVNSGGIIYNDANMQIFDKGLCWSTHTLPTVSDNFSPQGQGSGEAMGPHLNFYMFTSSIINLNANTTYYMRAYVVTETGTLYGDEMSFITSPAMSGEIKIGTQIWKQTNLDVNQYNNGDPIPQVQDDQEFFFLTTGAWKYYDINHTELGRLYNLYALEDTRGITPPGWRLPSWRDWDRMVNYIGSNSNASDYFTGCMLKIQSTPNWAEPNVCANNLSGFSGKPTHNLSVGRWAAIILPGDEANGYSIFTLQSGERSFGVFSGGVSGGPSAPRAVRLIKN